MTMASSLRDKQIASLRRMINLNSNVGATNVGSETTFSVLIYDKHGQDIISPLLSVKELREMGVTLHLLLHGERGEVPDVPAIYFCQPTEENLVRIGQDFADGLYSSYFLNFISPISRQKMEDLALAALQSGCQANIKKVYDQYVNFICLEDDMFTLKHQGSEALSYYAINRGDVKDSDIDVIMDSIVDSLFSVFVNLGQVPIIRCQRGNAAESVGERLDKKLRENLRDTRNSFFSGFSTDSFAAGQLSFQRPLLVLVDRGVDLATPLHHTWTYQALAHDVLSLSLNRVSLPEGDANTGTKPKTKDYDLNDFDLFWSAHKASAFPDVAAAVEKELEDYKAAETHVRGLKSNLQDDGAIDLLSDNTAKLTSAITSLPELFIKKANIDKHMSIAMALLNSIKSRKLDVFFEMEEKIMGRTTLEKPLLEIIKDPECGLPKDKLRIFLIFYLCSNNMTDAEFSEYVTALTEAGVDVKAVSYLKRWKSLMKMTAGAGGMSEYTGGVAKTVSMFSKLMNQGSALVVEGVNFVLKENKLPVTRIVDHLMELKNCEEEKDYRYFDPKMLRPTDNSAATPRTRTPFQDAVVFVVGGGNYMEYSNIASYAKKKAGAANKRVMYGCTDVINSEQFLVQLTRLGEEMS